MSTLNAGKHATDVNRGKINKLTSVSFSCVRPLIDHEFLRNIVKVAVDPRGDPQTH